MPLWTSVNNGLWTDAANWSGGVPDQNGAVANFVVTANTGALITTFLENDTISLGTLNVNISGTRDLLFQGSLTDSGSGVGTLSFSSADENPAHVTITTVVGGGEFEISSFGGLNVRIGNATIFDVVTAGTIARINAPIFGSGRLIKDGNGTLLLGSDNSAFAGGMTVEGGTVQALNAHSLGTNNVQIRNNALVLTSGTMQAAIGTQAADAGAAGSARIAAPTGTTLSIVDGFGHDSSGVLTLGSTTNNGTIVMGSSGMASSVGGVTISAATIRLETLSPAQALFRGSFTELTNGATIDTRGHMTTIDNLNLDAGTIRTSTGALRVKVFDTFGLVPAQTGVIEGTTNFDSFDVDVQNGFSLAGATFINWAATDRIQINGSVNANFITGSTQKDAINGLDGNDILSGNGGADVINGGNGDDVIILNSASGNAQAHGGANTDTLRVTGGSIELQSVSGFEALNLQNGATLQLDDSQFSGFAANSVLSGNGTLQIDVVGTTGSNRSIITKGMSVLDGSMLNLVINGATSNDIIKVGNGATHTINAGGGSNVVQGGNLADTINGGGGIDKIAGNGGRDVQTGGAGADVFKFRTADDSITGGNADVITDFLSGTDKLNFLRIDADAGTAGDQAFNFVGTGAFTGNGVGSIRYVDTGADLRVEADVDGDFIADMHVILQGAGAGVLTAADFVL